MVSDCARGGFDWTFRKISFLQGLSITGIGCPRKVVELPSLKVFKGHAGKCLQTWFSGGPDSAGLMVGLDDLRDLFQTKPFYDTVFLFDELI